MLKSILAGAALALLVSVGAHAGTVFQGPTADMPTGTSFDVKFNDTGGAQTVSFIIDGYDSLDGAGNCCEDDFSLALNGTPIMTGSFNLNGGGTNVVYTNVFPVTLTDSPSSLVANLSPFNYFNGGTEGVSLSGVGLLAGQNTLTFGYTSLAPTGNQGLPDEGWGIEQVAAGGSVPEPATWGLMLLGVAMIGGGLRLGRRGEAVAPVLI